MITFTARTTTEMAGLVYPSLKELGVQEDSRNGRVLRFPTPVTLTYEQPWVRGNLTEHRDANPFFHIAEAMWMLAGRRDVEFVCMFNKGMANYSDNGEVFNAAYGYRIRRHFGFDQLKAVVSVLRKDPASRQAVVQLWDAKDLTKDTKDKACNMQLVFQILDGHLSMTVYNRSNDAIYGNVTGANPVHMSYFQQWVADALGLPMGDLTFVTVNLHVYLDLYPHWEKLQHTMSAMSKNFNYRPSELGSLEEIEDLCNKVLDRQYINAGTNISPHIREVILPVINAWIMRKYLGASKNHIQGELSNCKDQILKSQCLAWLGARK